MYFFILLFRKKKAKIVKKRLCAIHFQFLDICVIFQANQISRIENGPPENQST